VAGIVYLADSILSQFHEAAQISDLNTAIMLYQNALHHLPAAHVQRSAFLDGLASAFVVKFHRTDQVQDLHEAISLLRQALVLLPSPHSERSALQNNLVAGLLIRYGKMKNLQDLRDAILLHRQARDLGLSSSEDKNLTEGSHKLQLYVRTTDQHLQPSFSYLFLVGIPGRYSG
jgi:hypothetical protein